MRIKLGMTQKELADALKIHQSAVAHWEKNNCGPKRSRMIEVASVLECTLEELIAVDE